MGSFFYVKYFWKIFQNLVYKMLLSVLIYRGIEQNIDFNNHYDSDVSV